MDTLSLVSKYLNGMEDILDDGDSLEARKLTVGKMVGQGAWDAELDMADSFNYMTEERFDQLGFVRVDYGKYGRKMRFLVLQRVRVDLWNDEMRIDLTMLVEMKDIDVMLDKLVEYLEEVGSSNGDLVKMDKASRNKNHKVNKLTPPPQIKIEEIPSISAIAPPSPIYHPLTQKQKEKVKEALDRKYKELEESKPILEILENYMTYRKKLDEVLMERARLSRDDYAEEVKMRIVKHQLPKKMCYLDNFVLPMKVNGTIEMNALADTGASAKYGEFGEMNSRRQGQPTCWAAQPHDWQSDETPAARLEGRQRKDRNPNPLITNFEKKNKQGCKVKDLEYRGCRERALSIYGDIYPEWCLEFFLTMYLDKGVDRTSQDGGNELDEGTHTLIQTEQEASQPGQARRDRQEPRGLDSSWGDWNVSLNEIERRDVGRDLMLMRNNYILKHSVPIPHHLADQSNFAYPAYEPPNVPPYPYPYVPYPHLTRIT
ncbi:hypothetical protein Tco_0771345 [Tanacetum coccineum]|uniref:Uncharacterized protein n=1 Tax=Tanacetum coccineum TaxID=301880 RepID=A0ABQ4ZES3_9ASTR